MGLLDSIKEAFSGKEGAVDAAADAVPDGGVEPVPGQPAHRGPEGPSAVGHQARHVRGAGEEPAAPSGPLLDLAAEPAPAAEPEEQARVAPPRRPYVVARGDTLESVAAGLGVPAAELARHNHLDAAVPIVRGQVLRIPAVD